MASVCLQNTKFSLEILPQESNAFWAKTRITLENEYVHYQDESEYISVDELEEWIFSAFRLLAGAYKREYSLSFEKAGLAIDLYPYTEEGREVSREERRKNDCVMMVRLLMRDRVKNQFLGGVYSLLFHRDDVKKFAEELRAEFDKTFIQRIHGVGEYHFVGVSPQGNHGCNYWYLDPFKKAKKGDFVWVRMGRHNKEQIVYVDSVRLCTEETAPYDPMRVKKVIRLVEGTDSEDIKC